MGNKPIVSFNSFELIQEAFVKNADAFAGRPNTQLKVLRGGIYGIVMTDGELWHTHRKFALHVLKKFGMGKNLMQERVINEVRWMIDEMKEEELKNGENEMSVHKKIDVAVGSIINLLIFGYAFHEQYLEEFFKIKNFMRDFIKVSGNPLFRILSADTSGILQRLPGFKTAYNEGKRLGDELRTFFNYQIQERRQKIDFSQDSEPTDYVEAYLREQQKNEKAGEDLEMFSNEQLFGCVFDMWLAAQETTSNTLSWMVLYMMTNPESQNLLHQELDKIIGSDRIITIEDKMNLPYVNAVVAETQRCCNLMPNNVPHRLITDINFHGYSLKADTIVVPQISSVLYDETIFPEPLKFKPERFIDANGKFISKPELIPFSIGKRACLGEGLARLELYLITANLLNQFELSIIPSKPPNMTPIIGGVKISQPFLTHVKQRF
uniref:Cytochrome P450 n=1 Tax=Panagrolaimus superbus TaxID=310955 RepID=A0A914Z7Z6_9BILA